MQRCIRLIRFLCQWALTAASRLAMCACLAVSVSPRLSVLVPHLASLVTLAVRADAGDVISIYLVLQSVVENALRLIAHFKSCSASSGYIRFLWALTADSDLLCVSAWLCQCLLESPYFYPVRPLGSPWLSGLMPGSQALGPRPWDKPSIQAS